MSLWISFLDHFGEGALGERRWGDEGEMPWKIVEADSEAEAIDKAWSNELTLILGRDPDEAHEGYPRSSWHIATAIPLDALPQTRVRFTERTEAMFHATKEDR